LCGDKTMGVTEGPRHQAITQSSYWPQRSRRHCLLAAAAVSIASVLKFSGSALTNEWKTSPVPSIPGRSRSLGGQDSIDHNLSWVGIARSPLSMGDFTSDPHTCVFQFYVFSITHLNRIHRLTVDSDRRLEFKNRACRFSSDGHCSDELTGYGYFL
jgi:hypothetical protein